MPYLTETECRDFKTTIMAYYHSSGRKFPWRETHDPYEILVSEIMLQQTQTERVVPKYTAWLERFPSVKELSEASLAEVLSLWSGLGYNRRARFLQESCRKIHLAYGGVFPEDPETLDSLPGIGPYTARAVAAFAFNRPEVFIETNIRSVFIFFFFPDRQDVSDKELLPLIAETLDADNPRIWYYALMDYGAELKRHVKNPNRQSRHYTKQSKFEGSLRQARGAVLRCLSLPPCTGLSVSYISEKEHLPEERVRQAAESLCAEKFICRSGDIYRIC